MENKNNQKQNNKPIKDTDYPRQIFKAGRAKMVFSVENYFSPPKTEDTIPPLQMHSKHSRILLTIIDISGEKTLTPKANIPARDIAGIIEKSRAAIIRKFGASVPEGMENTSSAYTQVISMGKFKDRTPADVLLNSPDEKDELLRTKDFLTSKMEQYPKNKIQINAIENALTLFEKGDLIQSGSEVKMTGSSLIYDVNHKYMNYKNKDGYTLFYAITINCDYANRYPWSIAITNFYAPTKKGPTNALQPIIDKKTGYAKSMIRLDDSEWCDMVRCVSSNLSNFETLYYPSLYKDMLSIEWRHTEAYRQKQQQESIEAENVA